MKKIIMTLVVLATTFSFTNVVSADTLNFCYQEGVLKAFQIGGYFIYALKVFVPVGIIILGMMDFFKAMTAGKDSELTKAAMSLGKRLIAGIIIFLLPMIVNEIITFAIGDPNADDSFVNCTSCMLSPTGDVCETEIKRAEYNFDSNPDNDPNHGYDPNITE